MIMCNNTASHQFQHLYNNKILIKGTATSIRRHVNQVWTKNFDLFSNLDK